MDFWSGQVRSGCGPHRQGELRPGVRMRAVKQGVPTGVETAPGMS